MEVLDILCCDRLTELLPCIDHHSLKPLGFNLLHCILYRMQMKERKQIECNLIECVIDKD